MKIATWNVNSVKARLPNIIEWLRSAQPDVLLLQEIKVIDGDTIHLDGEKQKVFRKLLNEKNFF